jgi:hypothetical protein
MDVSVAHQSPLVLCIRTSAKHLKSDYAFVQLVALRGLPAHAP